VFGVISALGFCGVLRISWLGTMGAKKTALDRSRKKSGQRIIGLDYRGSMNYEYEGPLRVLSKSGKKILIV
jgi:hypothetical protein